MKIGLIGLPLTGKTTVFNLLTGRSEETAAFESGKPGTHLASIRVPDARIDRLSAIFKPKKTTHAEIEFHDLAGFQVGGGGIESGRLSEMRKLDALVHVLRLFESDSVLRADGSTSALSDAMSLEQELILTDLILVEKRLERVVADIAKGRKELAPEQHLLEGVAKHLGDEKALRTLVLSPADEILLRGFQLVSRLPMILLGNTDARPGAGEVDALARSAAAAGLGFIAMNALAEWEISCLPESERTAFLEDLGVAEPARDRFIRTCFDSLGLVNFFTVGEDEVRAWTIERDLPAVKAAGKIHSDLERGFIRAEVIGCADFFAAGSMAEARKHGVLRLEGKDYRVRDGDIVTVRFNV